MNSLQRNVTEIILAVVAPALVMGAIGSFVLFLSTVFYHGEYDVRLAVILCLFTFASVLIARISIEQEPAYAAMYGVVLAAVMLLAMQRFVEIQGPLAPLSPLINIGLLAVVWFFADRLTWDSTFVDLTQDVSGRGLIDNIGSSWKKLAQTPVAPTPTTEDSLSAPAAAKPAPFDLLRWLRTRRPNTPGRWTIYFALLALPAFGLGQGLIPVSAAADRRFAFLMFAIYLISSLSLLMITSLIGLMRYLHQRNLELPNSIALSWLALGSVIGVGIIAVAWLVPRPAPEWSVIPPNFVSFLTPDSTKPNSWSVGNDGQQTGDGRASGTNPQSTGTPNSQQGSSQQSGPQQSSSPQSNSQQGGSQPGGSQQGNSQQGNSQQGNSQQGNSQQGNSQQGNSQQGNSQQGNSQQGNSQQGNSQQGNSQQGNSQQGNSQQGNSQQGNSQQGNSQQGNSQQGNSQQGNSQQGNSQQGNSQQGNSQQGNSQQGNSQQGNSQQNPGDRSSSPNSNSSDPRNANRRPQTGNPSANNNATASSNNNNNNNNSSGTSGNNNSPSSNSGVGTGAGTGGSSFRMPELPASLGSLTKWLAALVLVALLVLIAVLYGRSILAGLTRFFQRLAAWWAGLWGVPLAEPDAAAPAAVPVTPPKPFRDFADPFRSGSAAKWRPEELVAYSFQALEAWAREAGSPRQPQTTPIEFAQDLAQRFPDLASTTKSLTELVNRASYAPGSLSTDTVSIVQRFWQSLKPIAK